MNKKWLKRGLVLGVFLIFVYALAEMFLLDLGAEKRYLLDKEATIENFMNNESSFTDLRMLSYSLPSFNLSLSKSDSVYLVFNFDNHLFSSYDEYDNSIKIILDTFSNQKNWIIKTHDSTFIQTQKILAERFNHFEKISQLAQQVNCIRISNKEKQQLKIYFKTFYSSGFLYTSFYPDSSEYLLEQYSSGEKLNSKFYWHFDASLISYIHPHWIIPDSEFE